MFNKKKKNKLDDIKVVVNVKTEKETLLKIKAEVNDMKNYRGYKRRLNFIRKVNEIIDKELSDES